MTNGSQAQTPIAVVGMACRLPGGCDSPSQFWKLLLEGNVADTTPPLSRFSLASHYDKSLRPWTMRSPGGMFIDADPEDIDAGFFGLSQADAISMDPQQRQLLEVAYEGLESAGLTLEDVRSKLFCCVVGSYASDYSDMQSRDPEDKTPSFTVGSGRAMLSNRISHFLDIKGPSITIDTACSGSLVAVDLACRYLESGDADGAIVAGCNLYMSPEHNMDQRGMSNAASPSGRCWTFDARADGYIKAEAINAIVLKRLDDAVKDGDPIRAVIRGTSTNSDGWTPGIASPNADAQAAAIRRAYARAAIKEFQDTAYLECHGTGTPAGDLTECKAVASVFSSSRSPDAPLCIGSVKSNIGHSEPAAGISGLIKAILAVEHGIIPGNPTFQTPSPAIDFLALKLLPSRTETPWPSGTLRRASVNSFGYGGSNAHAIVEHPGILLPDHEPLAIESQTAREEDIFRDGDGQAEECRRLLVFSANDEMSLRNQVKSIVRHLASPATSIQSADLAYTLDRHRTRHFHRGYAILDRRTLREDDLVYMKPQTISRIGYVFTGQGSQWPQMGQDLVRDFPVAETTIRRLDMALQAMAEPPAWTLMNELVQPRSTEHSRSPEFSQPLLTALQLSLLAVLKDWGVTPSMVVGHSSGEIAAAVASGLLGKEDGIRVAYLRGKAAKDMQRLEPESTGPQGMLAVGLGSEDCQRFLSDFPRVTIACHNSPASVTLSGEVHELEELREAIKTHGHFARLLMVDLAYHSKYMGKIASRYKELLRTHCPSLSTDQAYKEVQFFSTVCGKLWKNACDIDYWATNMVSPVLFSQGVSSMINNGETNYLIEIGPSGALAGPINQIKQALGQAAATTVYSASWSRDGDPLRTLYDLAGKMFLRGVNLDLLRVNNLETGTKLRTITDLPSYCWNHSVKYWHESLSSHDWRYREFPIHDLLGSKVLGTSWEMPSFKRTLRLKDIPWIKEHTLGTEVVYPAAAYVSMAVEAMFQTARCVGIEGFADVNDVSQLSYRLRDVRLPRALTLEGDTDTYIYLFLYNVNGRKDSWYRFKISSLRGTLWTEHCSGFIRSALAPAEEYDALEPLKHQSSSKPWLKALKSVGFHFGPSFTSWSEVESVPGTKSNRAKMCFPPPSTRAGESKYPIHPTVFDSFFQVSTPSVNEGNRTSIDRVLVPRLIDEILISPISKAPQNAITETNSEFIIGRPDKAESFSYSTSVYDEQSKKVITKIQGLRFTDLHLPVSHTSAVIFMRSNWKPDITLLRDVDLGSLARSTSGLEVLSDGLCLPHDVAMVLSLLGHKLATLSVLDLDLTTNQVGEETVENEAELKFHLSAVARYVFASSTPEHMSNAQQRLGSLGVAEFHMYDDGDDVSQGDNAHLSGAKYDLVLLRTEVTEVRQLEHTIENARRFLTPTGFLVLVATAPRCNDVQSDALSASTPNKDIVNTLLHSLGLGLKLYSTKDPSNSTGSSSVFVCHSVGCASEPDNHSEFITVDMSKESPQCMRLIQQLKACGWAGTLVDMQEAASQPVETPLLLVDDPVAPLLATIDEEDWAHLKAIMAAGRKILWLTCGSQFQVSKPSNAIVHGFARSLRGEEPMLVLKTLDLSSFCSEDAATCVMRVMGCIANLHGQPTNENEYCERNGVIYISRVGPHRNPATAAAQSLTERPLEDMRLHKNPNTVRLHCERVGAMDSLNFNELTGQPGALGEDELEVEILAAGLNYKDIAAATGIVPDNEHMLGCGGAGVIRHVGRNVTSYKAGDRVLIHERGCFANRLRLTKDKLFLLPDSASFEEAATINVAYFTAVYGLMEIAQVQKAQSVLIHSAAGGVGLACIQICRYLGAEIYATVGNDEKKRFLESNHGIPSDRIFSSRNVDFAAGIRSLTDGRGVDCVINALTGDLLDESWRLLADNGTFIEIGKRDILDRNTLSMEPFDRNCTFRGVDISKPSILNNPSTLERILQKIRSLWVEGKIKPIAPMKVFSFAAIPDAMKLLRSGKHIGKIVISDGDAEDVKVPIRRAAISMRFDPDAAYLLVGGLRGLCGSLAVYLARSGAKNLIVMSRSGAGDERSRRVIRDLTSLGTMTKVCSGDVSVLEDVVNVFRNSALPVKGVIQGAMVLRDKTFESMNVQEYHEALTCKVTGTWNLHHAAVQAQHSLDFFTMLSSISGIVGTAGQANYCAGNSFQDAFAQYRHSLGLPAHTVDLGIIEDVGYMSEHQDLTDRVRSRSKLPGISEKQLHEILKFSILQQQQQPQAADGGGLGNRDLESSTQMITGLPYPLPPDSPVLQSDMRFSSLAVSSTLAHSDSSGAAGMAGGDTADGELRVFEAMRKAAVPAEKLVPEVVRLVGRQFVRSLGLTADMEESKPLSSFGIDSLAAVDLRNWVKVHLKTELTTLEVLNSESLGALCEKIVGRLLEPEKS